MEQRVYFLLLISISVKSQVPETRTETHSVKLADLCLNFTSHYKDFHSNCCTFPPFFPPEVTNVCRSLYEVVASVLSKNITALWKQPLTVCDHWKCVLKEHNLLNDENETVKEMKYFNHLDKWAEKHPTFKNMMRHARIHCITKCKKRTMMKVCDFFNVHGCIIKYLSKRCPSKFEDEGCKNMAKVYELCEQFNKYRREKPSLESLRIPMYQDL